MTTKSSAGARVPKVLRNGPWIIILALGLALLAGAAATVLPPKYLVVAGALPLLATYFVLALTRFDLAILLLLFFAPLLPTSVGVELSSSLPLITLQRVMLACLYVALLLRLVSNQFVLRLPRISRIVWLTVVLYFGASVLSSLFSTVPLKSLYRVFAHLFDSVGLFAMVASAAMRYREKAFTQRALTVLWASFTVLALLGIVDTLTGLNPLYYLPAARRDVFTPVYRLGVRRGQGLLPNPTALGMVAATGAILTLLMIAWQKRRTRGWGLWLLLPVYLAALAGTVTRTGWIAFVLGCIIWVFLARRIRIQLILLALVFIGLLLAMGAGAVLYAVIVSGFDISQQNEISTLLSRLTWARVVWTNLTVDKTRLLFGYGPGTLETLHSLWSYAGFRANLTTDYVIRLAEGGLIGLSSFLLLLIVSVVQCRKPIRSSERWVRYAGIFLLIAFIQIVLGSVTLPLFVWAQTTYVFWMLLGVLVALNPSRKTPVSGPSLLAAATPETDRAE
jgi:O-antigen ligase